MANGLTMKGDFVAVAAVCVLARAGLGCGGRAADGDLDGRADAALNDASANDSAVEALDAPPDVAADATAAAFRTSWVKTFGENVRLADFSAADGTSVLLLSYFLFEGSSSKGSGKLLWHDGAGTRLAIQEVDLDPSRGGRVATDKAGNAVIVHFPGRQFPCGPGACLALASPKSGLNTLSLAEAGSVRAALAADGKGGAFVGNRRGFMDLREGPYLAMRVDSSLKIVWRVLSDDASKCLTGPCAGGAEALAADSSGGVYAVAFDPIAGTTSAGPTGIAVHRIDAAGKILWSRRAGGAQLDSSDCRTTSITVASDGSPTVVGLFRGKLDFGGGTTVSAGADRGGFVARYTPAGVLVSARSFAFSGGCLDVAPSGDQLVLGGSFNETISYGSDVLSTTGWSGFIATASREGEPLRGVVTGAHGSAITAPGGAGNVLFAAEFAESHSLLGASVVHEGGGFNAFIARIELP